MPTLAHLLCSILLLVAPDLHGEVPSESPDQPNIVVFMVDDLGWQDTSLPLHEVTTPFNAIYWTPNLERLAKQGMAFTNAYSGGPVCTPTRTSLMTGQCPGRSHITYWTFQKDTDTSKKRAGLAPPDWRLNGLSDQDQTLPQLLSKAGYRTIHVGKAHFGAHGTPGAAPTVLGFDVNIAGHASGAPASFLGTHNFSAAGRRGSGRPSLWDVPGLEAWHGQDVYLTEALADEALAQIDLSVDHGKPFFLHLAPYAVHVPIMANKRHLDRYTTLHPTEAAYATMVESYDEALGAVLDRLEHHGVADNTIVVFASDNGGLSAHARGGKPHTHNAPLRSGKGSAYEGGTRVPTVIYWPGLTEPSSSSDVAIVTYDLFPTLLAAAGVAMPAGTTIDGLDLEPVLSQQASMAFDERVIGWNQPHQWGAAGPGIEPFTSIRSDDHKLIYFHDGPRFELYDLASDLSESNDLATVRPDILGDMVTAMRQWIDDTGAQLSIDKATGQVIVMPDDALAD